MEDNIYKIQENINRIFIEIEENAGEITEEQLEQLNINQENLKQNFLIIIKLFKFIKIIMKVLVMKLKDFKN